MPSALRTRFRRHRISIDCLDLEGLSRLLSNGFTIQEAMALLKGRNNQEVFEHIEKLLNEGNKLPQFFPELCPKQYRAYLSGFLKCLSFSDSLCLATEVVSGEEAQKKEYIRGLFYPCMMFVLTIAGILLFNEFCFPPLLSMMEGFHVKSGNYDLTRLLFRIFSGSVILLLSIALILLFYFTRPSHQVKGYILLSRHFPESVLVQYESADFIRFFLQCIRMNVSTRETIRILKDIPQKPVIAFLAKTLEDSLLKGSPFEQAVRMPWLDPALSRFLKIAFYSSEMETMLEGYLEMSQERAKRQCRKITRIIQVISYLCIGAVLILVYQILMLPMSILTQM